MTIWVDAGWYGRFCRVITTEDGSRAICHVWARQNSRRKTRDGTEPWPEGKANFDLILAAPQMLEALEAIVGVDIGCTETEETNPMCYQCQNIARAAIVAAKGEDDEKA